MQTLRFKVPLPFFLYLAESYIFVAYQSKAFLINKIICHKYVILKEMCRAWLNSYSFTQQYTVCKPMKHRNHYHFVLDFMNHILRYFLTKNLKYFRSQCYYAIICKMITANLFSKINCTSLTKLILVLVY